MSIRPLYATPTKELIQKDPQSYAVENPDHLLQAMNYGSVRKIIDEHNNKLAKRIEERVLMERKNPLRDLTEEAIPRMHSVDQLKLKYMGTSIVLPEKELERLRQTRSWSSPLPNYGKIAAGVKWRASSPFGQASDENRPSNLPFSPLNLEQVHKLRNNGGRHLNQTSHREFEDRMINKSENLPPVDDDEEITFITLPVEGIANAQHIITEEAYPFSPDLKGCRGEIDIECTTARSRRSSSSATQPSARPSLQETHRNLPKSDSPDTTTRICGDSACRACERIQDENIPPAIKLSARGSKNDRKPIL